MKKDRKKDIKKISRLFSFFCHELFGNKTLLFQLILQIIPLNLVHIVDPVNFYAVASLIQKLAFLGGIWGTNVLMISFFVLLLIPLGTDID